MTDEEIKIELQKIREELSKLYEVVQEYMNEEKIINRR